DSVQEVDIDQVCQGALSENGILGCPLPVGVIESGTLPQAFQQKRSSQVGVRKHLLQFWQLEEHLVTHCLEPRECDGAEWVPLVVKDARRTDQVAVLRAQRP